MCDALPDNCGVSRRIVMVQHLGLVFPQFRPLPATASLKRAKTSWYNCLSFAQWYKFMMCNAFPIKKHNLELWPTHPRFLWSRRPFPHPMRRTHLGFNIIPINPCLTTCYDVLKKFSITFTFAVPDWFQHGSLSDRQTTNAARIFH